MPFDVFKSEKLIQKYTDHYFNQTKKIVCSSGEINVKYAVFMRRPVIFTPRLMVDNLNYVAKKRNFSIKIDLCCEEGDWVGAGDPLLFISGPFSKLVDLETLFLQNHMY